MPLSLFMMGTVILVGGYGIYRIARKQWRKADVEEKQDELEALHDNYESVKGINTKTVQKERQRIKDVLDS